MLKKTNRFSEYETLRVWRNSHFKRSNLLVGNRKERWYGLSFLTMVATLISWTWKQNLPSLFVIHGTWTHRSPQTSFIIRGTPHHQPITLFCLCQDLLRCESFLISENKAASSKTNPFNAIKNTPQNFCHHWAKFSTHCNLKCVSAQPWHSLCDLSDWENNKTSPTLLLESLRHRQLQT